MPYLRTIRNLNIKIIIQMMGILLVFNGVFMLIAALISFFYNESVYKLILLAGLISVVIGALCQFGKVAAAERDADHEVRGELADCLDDAAVDLRLAGRLAGDIVAGMEVHHRDADFHGLMHALGDLRPRPPLWDGAVGVGLGARLARSAGVKVGIGAQFVVHLAAEQVIDRLVERLAHNIPAGHLYHPHPQERPGGRLGQHRAGHRPHRGHGGRQRLRHLQVQPRLSG